MEPGSFPTLIAQAVMVLVPMVLSLTVHEYSHALAAKLLGDDTAERQGRLTLNPLSHADPIGTVLLPLIILVAHGAGAGRIPFFGWAKPVPVNGGRLTRKMSVRSGLMIVSAAGPVSNLLLATLCAGILSAGVHSGIMPANPGPMIDFLQQMILTNIGLFVFNMIPVAPLDGQKVVSGLLSTEQAIRFERFNYQFGMYVLLALIFFAQDVISLPVILVSRGVLAAVGLG